MPCLCHLTAWRLVCQPATTVDVLERSAAKLRSRATYKLFKVRFARMHACIHGSKACYWP
jgi:hypothetical protein